MQAIPPDATFSWLPQTVVTVDGRVLTGGAVEAIFPGPLLMPVFERQVSARGWLQIVDAGRAAGLLTGKADFTDGALAPGSVATRLEILADGRLFDVVGDATRVMNCITTPCDPQPGTPEAFAGFVNRFFDLGGWLGPDAGPEQPYIPRGYAVLVGPPPDDQGIPQPPLAWPFEAGLASFGKPLADGSGRRCGLVQGGDATTLRPILQAARSTTRFRDPADESFHGLTVRPLLPGDEDPCGPLV